MCKYSRSNIQQNIKSQDNTTYQKVTNPMVITSSESKIDGISENSRDGYKYVYKKERKKQMPGLDNKYIGSVTCG